MVQAAVSPVVRKARQASPERWQQAARRAVAEGIQVRQINTSGMWTATSGTHANVAYVLEIAQGVVRTCSCPAGTFGDPCCKHAARYYLDAGLLEIDDPEPDPPALGGDIDCPDCSGCGVQWYRDYTLPCASCGGCGETAPQPYPVQPAAQLKYLGRAGHIAGYDVLIGQDALSIQHAATGRQWQHAVPNYGTRISDLAQRPGFRTGWGRFPDDAEVLYFYDRDDGQFGYAVNLSDPALSEWGYAPFADAEPSCDHCDGPLGEDAETDDALQTVCAACAETNRVAARESLAAAISADHAQAVSERARLAA